MRVSHVMAITFSRLLHIFFRVDGKLNKGSLEKESLTRIVSIFNGPQEGIYGRTHIPHAHYLLTGLIN